jgi:YVTN family beta-propeller protein
MKKAQILFILLMISIIISCSSDEKTINPVETSSQVLAAIETGEVKIINLPDFKEVNADILAGKLSFQLTGPITNMKKFGEYLYLSARKDYKIIILDLKTLDLKAIIDFSDKQAEVGEIAFPNSTDAYVVHPNKNFVSIIDVTVFKIAREITVGTGPSSIDVSGNQIIVTNKWSNDVSIIDSRTHSQEALIPVASVPSFVRVTNDGKYAVIASIGYGKVDSIQQKSPAVITYINISGKSINNQFDLGYAQIDPVQQNPVGFVVTPSDWGFVATTENLFRIDIKNKTDINLVVRRNFYNEIHDAANQKIILFSILDKSNKIIQCNDKTGTIKGNIITVPYKITFILPWR